ncbi:hypothetical protein CGGC5_v004647 [Colletotrichum fructicola Nara gc5]|uniref:Extracellular membrane protein CFEM domain-containing protein n=1 Tax=Colletotrichum fructicola (strain Nara gc5) TaxID=1213859 RepID=A0A7J6JET7_COLFN|nr:hypothetical protein CGGC5_v004647 [Colletotrichum fructicola Nara gc5]
MRSQLYVIGIVGFWILEHVEAVYYLDQADGYSALPSCAEIPISSIVRDMVSGCGDGGRTTSYSCFCTASSDRFSNIIATAVAKNCGQLNAEVASATQVFDAYCQLGKADEATDVSGPTSTTGGSIPTSSPASSNAEPSSGLSTGAVIAVSTCVSLVTIAIFITVYLLWRRRRANRKTPSVEADTEVFVEKGERKGAQGNDGTVENFKAELDASNEINELPTPPPPRTMHELQ